MSDTNDAPPTDSGHPPAINRNGEPIRRDPEKNAGRPLPPVSTQIKPGDRLNPNGRRPAGASIREWYNVLADPESGTTTEDLRTIINDPRTPWTKKAAAAQALDTAERPDMATFENVRAGRETIEQARNRGLPTDQIKKFRLKTRSVKDKAGNTITETESEIELHERAASAIDRLHDRTEGKPVQAIDLDANLTQESTAVRARRIPDQSAYKKPAAPAAGEDADQVRENADSGNP